MSIIYLVSLYLNLVQKVYGLLEQNIPTSDFLDNPELYKESTKNSYQVVAWIATADSGGKCQT